VYYDDPESTFLAQLYSPRKLGYEGILQGKTFGRPEWKLLPE
jgi:hypothetical protein